VAELPDEDPDALQKKRRYPKRATKPIGRAPAVTAVDSKPPKKRAARDRTGLILQRLGKMVQDLQSTVATLSAGR
jgi:hypothetical protein